MKLQHLKEASRFFRRALLVRFTGFKQYEGNPEKICRQILSDCYLKDHFVVSNGHFSVFYIRDFVFNCRAMNSLGYKKEVRSTFKYALDKFASANRITTTISKDGVPFNFPSYTPESLALILHGLLITKNEDLAKKYRTFLQKEIDFALDYSLDKKSFLPRTDIGFQSLRDQVRTKASCYSAVMIAVILRDGEKLGFRVKYNWKKVRKSLLKEYWNGNYFYNDLSKQDIVVGDANVFPFWAGIITDKDTRKKAINSIIKANLDIPAPLKYVNALDKHREKRDKHLGEIFSKDYMTDSIWIHLGLAYLEVLQVVDKERTKKHLRTYGSYLKKHRTFLEVYNSKGDIYKTPFYITDEAMSWCASYLNLAKKMKTI